MSYAYIQNPEGESITNKYDLCKPDVEFLM